MLRNSNRSTFEIHSNVFRQIVVLLGWSHDMKIGQPKEMRRKEWMKAKEWENEWMREVRFEFLPKYQTNKRKQNRRCIIYTNTHTHTKWLMVVLKKIMRIFHSIPRHSIFHHMEGICSVRAHTQHNRHMGKALLLMLLLLLVCLLKLVFLGV